MSKFSNDQSVKKICDAIESGSCIAFIGSGLSAPAVRSNGQRLPTWKGLLSELVENEIKGTQEKKELNEMIEKNELLMAAEVITKNISRKRFEEYLVSVFDDPALAPTANHKLLKDIGFRAIITSNYDRLIELAYDTLPPIYNQKDIQKHGELLNSGNKDFYILKNHGDIKEPWTIVLGTRDYNELFFKDPGYRKFLETIFLSNTAVFIGFGDNDADITQTLMSNEFLLPQINGGERHYLLMARSTVNGTEKKWLFQNKGIMVVEYENPNKDHSQVYEFLRELKEQITARRELFIDRDIRGCTNDIGSIMFSNSRKYYDMLRGGNGRYHHLKISDLLLTDIDETFIETFMKVNDTDEEIPLHSSVEKLWHSKYMHAVLVGEGGMGKTVSVIRLWQKYLSEDKINPPIPVFLALNEYNSALPDERNYILKMIGRHYWGKHEMDNSEINRLWNYLREPGKDGKPSLILFLDGFNEVTVDKKNLIIELNEILETALAVQIIITSRFDMRSVQNWTNMNKLELTKLSDRQIEQYIGKQNFLNLSGKILLETLRNPMMLTIYNKTCGYINICNNLYQFKDRVQTAGELLWNYFEGQRMKKHEMYKGDEGRKALFDLVMTHLLSYIGYKMENAGQFFLSEDGLEQTIFEAYEGYDSLGFLKMNPEISRNYEYLEIGSLEGNKRLKRYLRIKDILCNDLTVIVMSDGTYRFLHQNFRDYFAAVHILNEIQMCLSGVNILPDVMVKWPVSLYVGNYMGEIEGEHYNVPVIDNKNRCWSVNHYQNTRLVKLLVPRVS